MEMLIIAQLGKISLSYMELESSLQERNCKQEEISSQLLSLTYVFIKEDLYIDFDMLALLKGNILNVPPNNIGRCNLLSVLNFTK